MITYIDHKRYIVVFHQYIAGELMKRGFVLMKIDGNQKFPDKNVFLFSNSRAIVDAYNEVYVEFKGIVSK